MLTIRYISKQRPLNEALRLARSVQGTTTREVAKATGLTNGTITQIELGYNGNDNPKRISMTALTLFRLAKYYGLDLNTLEER